MTQLAHHESSPDGVVWSASMEVTLRKTASPAGADESGAEPSTTSDTSSSGL
jgi:hypothetical protein